MQARETRENSYGLYAKLSEATDGWELYWGGGVECGVRNVECGMPKADDGRHARSHA